MYVPSSTRVAFEYYFVGSSFSSTESSMPVTHVDMRNDASRAAWFKSNPNYLKKVLEVLVSGKYSAEDKAKTVGKEGWQKIAL